MLCHKLFKHAYLFYLSYPIFYFFNFSYIRQTKGACSYSPIFLKRPFWVKVIIKQWRCSSYKIHFRNTLKSTLCEYFKILFICSTIFSIFCVTPWFIWVNQAASLIMLGVGDETTSTPFGRKIRFVSLRVFSRTGKWHHLSPHLNDAIPKTNTTGNRFVIKKK